MADVPGLEQVWTAQGFHDRFASARARRHRLRAHQRRGGAGPRAAVLLAEYLSAVHEQIAYLAKVTPRTSTGSSTEVGPAGDAGGPAGQR